MRILLIGLHYHGYTEAIAAELREFGHEVLLHDIQPRDLPMKILRIAAPKIWQARLDTHHRKILRTVKNVAIDLVLFIQTHQMSHENLRAFKQTFPDARFALYNWDSLTNHDYLDRSDYFDTIQTFDPDDAARHGFEYLPLFASRQFQNVPDRVEDPRSVYFVGNIVNPNRYRAIERFREYCEEHGIAFRSYLATTPVIRRALKREKIQPVGLSSGSISSAAFREMLETSSAVFDFANHKQSGYTMRIFENLCAGKKIITSNSRIAHEDFYSPDRIHIFSEHHGFQGVAEFLDVPLENPGETYPEYRIQAFARHLVDGTGHPIPQSFQR